MPKLVEKKKRSQEISYVLTNTKDGEGDGIKILLCGLTGSGRSQLASTFPNPLFLNADHGLDTPAVKESNANQIYLKRGDEISRIILQTYFDIEHKKGTFEKWQPETLIIDTFSSVTEFLLIESLIYEDVDRSRTGDNYQLQDYMNIWRWGTNIIEMAKGICPYTIFICNVDKHEDPILNGKVESPAAAGQKLSTQIGHAFADVYYCDSEKINSKHEWFIKTQKDSRFKYCKTKYKLPEKIIDPSFDKLKKYYGV